MYLKLTGKGDIFMTFRSSCKSDESLRLLMVFKQRSLRSCSIGSFAWKPFSLLSKTTLSWDHFGQMVFTFRSFINRREAGIFPFYSGMFPLLLLINLYRVYMEPLPNHPPTLPRYLDVKKVNETPVTSSEAV